MKLQNKIAKNSSPWELSWTSYILIILRDGDGGGLMSLIVEKLPLRKILQVNFSKEGSFAQTIIKDM